MGSHQMVSIPVIDISSSNSQAAQQLLDAATRYGFVYIENNAATGIFPSDIDHMFELSKIFFASPLQVKDAVSIRSNKAGKNHGWLGQGVEKLDPKVQKRPDVKEAFNMGFPRQDGTFEQSIPQTLMPHVSTLRAFQIACHDLCQHILTLFATALQLSDPHWFTSRHDPALGPVSCVFRLLYYPKTVTHEPGVDIRAGAHSDYGSITLLFQQPNGAPGLEIQTPSGDWSPVPVNPPAIYNNNNVHDDTTPCAVPILVNIGDLLEEWTNGLLKSTMHRVVFPAADASTHPAPPENEDRYSLAYFCHPLDAAVMGPVPSRLVRERHNKATAGVSEQHVAEGTNAQARVYKTARDHLMERLAATYSV